MPEYEKIYIILLIIILLSTSLLVRGQIVHSDTLPGEQKLIQKYNQFYDTLKVRSQQKKVSSLLYNMLISESKPSGDWKSQSLEYLNAYKNKIIKSINITALDVFGPTFSDTTKKAKGWIEKSANELHTKSNLQTIKKMLLFKAGDLLDPDVLYENERIIRAIPYIRDVRFYITPDSIYPESVNVHVITKDRFSFGITGYIRGGDTGAFEVYNQNIFGVGHEVSTKFVGHLQKKPYLGFETFYRINNIRGKFIDIAFGYSDTYLKEGLSLIFDKQFLTPKTNWGYGASMLRLFRSDRIFDDDPVITEGSLNLFSWSAWAGKSFQISANTTNNPQLVLTTGIVHRKFYERPLPDDGQNQYFSNNTFYMGGLSFSKRNYIRDQLVYSYGITEDIPKGFKYEIIYGFDANEFGNRNYLHAAVSNGNLMGDRPHYLYFKGAIGGYFPEWKYEQGMIRGNLNYISKLYTAGRKYTRFFAEIDYTLGIRRFDIENLFLKGNDHIRGFTSLLPKGKQRFTLNLECVFFQQKEFYKFNFAFFPFFDGGIIGSNNKFLLKGDYYGGLGIGIRLHNESLVFKTLQLRLAFYPNHPSDMAFIGFILEERVKQKFYNFNPEAPSPLKFE